MVNWPTVPSLRQLPPVTFGFSQQYARGAVCRGVSGELPGRRSAD